MAVTQFIIPAHFPPFAFISRLDGESRPLRQLTLRLKMSETKPPSLVPEGITDVYPHALSFLPLTDIARLSLVSTEWRDASNHALPKHVKLFMKRRNQLLSAVEEKLRPKH